MNKGYNDKEIKIIGEQMMFHSDDIFLFHENGKVGIKNLDGSMLVPAEYDQIEKCEKYIYILQDDYLFLFGERNIHGMNIHTHDNGYMFAKNGKLGWKDIDGNILIPALYDEIQRWGKDLYVVQTGKRWHYINGNMVDLLSSSDDEEESVEDDYNEFPPFNFSASNNKVLTIQEYVGHEVDGDDHVVTVDDEWERLSLKTGTEIAEMLVNPHDELPMTKDDLRLFNNSFSYEFNAYLMYSNKEKGICDCLRQAYKMRANGNSWYYIVKVWKAPGEEPLADELRALRYAIDRSRQLGELQFALGHDESLKSGETKMLMITHYNERCFPPSIEFEWTNFLNEQPLDVIKVYIPELRKRVESTYLQDYIDEVWWDMLHDRIDEIRFDTNRTWEETERVLDYLKENDTAYVNGVYWTVELFMDCDMTKTNPYFYIRKLEWLLKNGANVNVYKQGKTGLDLLNQPPRDFLNDKPVDERAITECKKVMLQYGALTMKELKKQESLNNDYMIELGRMK